MNKINYKKSLAFLVPFLFFIPLFMFAAEIGSGNTTIQKIQNPLGLNNTSVQDLLVRIMGLVATVGAIVVVFFIIYSGYKIVMARGNPGDLEKAKDMFFATIIGGAILLGADVIANVVVNTVNTTVGR